MTEDGRRPGGRSARVRRAVLDATLAIVVADGPQQLTVARVAESAGVHETTIYRRWRTREQLMVAAMLDNSAQVVPLADTGSVHRDLAELARGVAGYLATPVGAAFARVAALAVDDDALTAVRREFWQARLDAAAIIVRRGVQRGELAADTDPRLVLETLVAPLYLRTLLTHAPVEQDLPDRLAGLIRRGSAPG